MTLSKIQYTEDDGVWYDISLRDLEELVKSEHMETEATELFNRKRRYLKFIDGCMIRLVWKR